MLNADDINQITQKLSNTYGQFEKMTKERKKEILKCYFVELKQYNAKSIIDVIDKLSMQKPYIPTVAEIKVAINEKNEENASNINWNSSYWFEIDREICEREGIPYYDITKGIEIHLEPYKA